MKPAGQCRKVSRHSKLKAPLDTGRFTAFNAQGRNAGPNTMTREGTPNGTRLGCRGASGVKAKAWVKTIGPTYGT